VNRLAQCADLGLAVRKAAAASVPPSQFAQLRLQQAPVRVRTQRGEALDTRRFTLLVSGVRPAAGGLGAVIPPGRGHRGDWRWWVAAVIALVSVVAVIIGLALLVA
jgi:hypothetical protein